MRLLLLLAALTSAALPAHGEGWPVTGGDPGGRKYSALSDINANNVDQLDVAWVYRTGDSSELKENVPDTSFIATPVLHNNTLFFCSGLSRAFAVDAETGEELWVYDSKPDMADTGTAKCRGVALWEDTEEKGACALRVFMGTLDGRLAAVDGKTGKPCADFGDNGIVDLREGLGPIIGNEMAVTSAPVVLGDVVINGAMIGDNNRVDPPGGVIRGWDARTGELRWAFDPVPPGSPSPAEIGAPEGQRYHSGTPNVWTLMSTDPDRNLVFLPFGTPGLDFIGGHRKARGFDADYYSSALVALNGETGEVVWRYQTVHQDLWDYDLAAQPLLMDLEVNGETQPAVIQATKMGHVFILHRETGEPLYTVEERAVPQTDIPGEYTSPTQPFPTFPKPLHPHSVSPDDARGMLYFDKKACREKIEAARNEGIFTPPALNRYSIQYPGVAGGQNWGGMALDAKNKLLVMPQNYVVTHNKLIPRDEAPAFNDDEAGMGVSPNIGTPFVIRHEVLLSPLGAPCLAPPWGKLLAVSLETGDIVWEVPFGTPKDMVPGLSWLPLQFFNMGFPSAGGPVVTGSGLVFIGAAMDNYLRAYDSTTGEELWRHRLPAGAQATPMTFRGEKTGKQFVVIAAGGHAYMRTQLGDSLVAFALGD